jgi:hypothetical protein
MKQNQVTEKLFALLNSGGARQTSTITLTDGNTLVGIPHGFHMFNAYCSMDVFNPQTSVSQSIPLDTVTDIVTDGFR